MGDLSELLSQYGMGNYMDGPAIPPRSRAAQGFSDAMAVRDLNDQEDRQRSLLLAMLYKKYYPQADDRVAGQWARQQLLNNDLNTTLQRHNQQKQQMWKGMTY